MAIDYSAGSETTLPNKEELNNISELATSQVQLEMDIKAAEKALGELKARHLKLRTEALPEAMKQVGLTEFTLSNGSKISIKDGIDVSIPVPKKPEAFEWLRENGHGDIIKNDVTLSFGTGQDAQKDVAIEFAEHHNFQYAAKEAVHAGTLKAWAKKQLELDDQTNALPEDLITVYRYDVAKVDLPKKVRR